MFSSCTGSHLHALFFLLLQEAFHDYQSESHHPGPIHMMPD
jgi:hypothetical protein